MLRHGSTIAAVTRPALRRLRIALLATLCLLFQQVALASYLCPPEQMPVAAPAMSEQCADAAMAPAQDNAPLCEQHCNPDHTVAADSAKLSVPALALPLLAFAVVLVEPVSQSAAQSEVPTTAVDPPPRLRYCSLLI